jgi:hypothetical protein
MRHIRFIIAATAALLALAAFGSSAQAAQGYLRGQLQFYQNQGQYCGAGKDCKGANYVHTQFGTFMGVAEAKLVVKDAVSKATIGFGSTTANGDFTVFWMTPFAAPASAEIYVRSEHSTGRFAVQDFYGNVFEMLAVKVPNLIPSTTSQFPQDVSTWRFGSSSSPHAQLNVYDGAWRTWAYALSESNLMWQKYTGINIRAFVSSTSGTCTTSCADAGTLTVKLDDQAVYAPQARVMHELGHLVSAIANPHHPLMNLSYPYESSIPGQPWLLNGAEWAADAFEEGFATFIADAVMYEANAPSPATCAPTGEACKPGAFNVEFSPSTCSAGQERWPLTVARALRDYYDTVNEAGDTRSTSFAQMLEVWASYPVGRDDHQNEEPFDADGWPDNKDGRSVRDFQHNYDVFWGSSTAGIWKLNCNAL